MLLSRNYLEHVAGTIVEWIQQEEAKYQAHLLAFELENLRLEELDQNAPSDEKDGKKKPNKSDRFVLNWIKVNKYFSSKCSLVRRGINIPKVHSIKLFGINISCSSVLSYVLK